MSFTFGFLLFCHVFSGDNRANKLEKWKRNVRRLKHVGAVGFVSIIYDIFSYKYLDTFDIMEDNPFNIPFSNKRISFAVGFRWLLLLSWGSFLRQRLQILYFVFILMTNSSSWSLWQKYCRQIIPKTRGLKTRTHKMQTKKLHLWMSKTRFVSTLSTLAQQAASNRMKRVSILITSGHFFGRKQWNGIEDKMHNRKIVILYLFLVSLRQC